MKGLPPKWMLLIGEVIILFSIPFLPKSVLLLTDNIIVRILLLTVLLASSLAGPYVLLLTFVVVLALLGLRNQMKINDVQPLRFDKMASAIEMPPVLAEIPQPLFETPTDEAYEFEPQADTGSNDFEAVDTTINQKVVLPTQVPDGMGGKMFI